MQTPPMELPYDYNMVFDGTTVLLPSLGFRVTNFDKARGVIWASTDMNLVSWGEDIVIQLGSAHAGTTSIVFNSNLKFGLVDWGRNGSNVTRIQAGLSSYLADWQRQLDAAKPESDSES